MSTTITRAWPADLADDGRLRPLSGLNEEVARRFAEVVTTLMIFLPGGELGEAAGGELPEPLESFTGHLCITSDYLRRAHHWLVTREPAD